MGWNIMVPPNRIFGVDAERGDLSKFAERTHSSFYPSTLSQYSRFLTASLSFPSSASHRSSTGACSGGLWQWKASGGRGWCGRWPGLVWAVAGPGAEGSRGGRWFKQGDEQIKEG